MSGHRGQNHPSGFPQHSAPYYTQNYYQTTSSQYGAHQAYSSALPSRPPRDTEKYTLYKIPMRMSSGGFPLPFPDHYDHRRDRLSGFVRMPCSSTETVPLDSSIGARFKNGICKAASAVGIPYIPLVTGTTLLWDNILDAFEKKKIDDVQGFESVVRKYNPDAADGTQGFFGLHNCLKHMRPKEEVGKFFQMYIGDIIRLSSLLKTVVTSAPPLLRAGNNASVSLSQYQAACLLANAFMCTFPMRNGTRNSSGTRTYPDFNFDRLFEPVPDASRERQKTEKLRCILNYFRRVGTITPAGALTITRRKAQGKTEDWWRSRDTPILSNVHIMSTGSIEDAGEDMVQIDFANKYIGGGVLGNGLVQEEIRFLQFPEMILTRLLCERLEDDEAILIIGAERYNETEGYARTFRWKANFSDNTPADEFMRKNCQVVAMDAMDFSQNYGSQYELGNITRELNKALVGFSPFSNESSIGGEHLSGVATGNWGCGAFGGDPRLKFLIQLMAVSEASRRKMAYYTYQDKTLAADLQSMQDLMVQKKVTVGQLFNIVERYSEKSTDRGEEAVYKFVSKHLGQDNTRQIGEQTLSEKTRSVTERRRFSSDLNNGQQRIPSYSANSVQQLDVSMDKDLNCPPKSDDGGIGTSGQHHRDQQRHEDDHAAPPKRRHNLLPGTSWLIG